MNHSRRAKPMTVTFTDQTGMTDQKTLFHVGMFPAEIMEQHKDLGDRDVLPITLSVALMDCAQKAGWMRVDRAMVSDKAHCAQ